MSNDQFARAIEEMEAQRETVCDHAGHEWGDAGGGLQVCLVCLAEQWEDERDA